MTRSNTPGAATGAGNSNKDYSVSADPSDALGVDSLDDDLGSDALAAAVPPSRVPTVASRVADETPRSVVVPDEMAGERLDKVLARVFPEFSRNRLQSWIESERVRIDGKPAKIRQPVPLGATIELVPETRTQFIYVGNKGDALKPYAGKTIKLTGKVLETGVPPKTINIFWPGRLVDDHQRVVLVDDLERHRFGRERELLRQQIGYELDGGAKRHRLTNLRRLAVDAHPFRLDPALQPVT